MTSQVKDLFDHELHVNSAELEYPEFLSSGGVRNKILTKLTGSRKGPFLTADAISPKVTSNEAS